MEIDDLKNLQRDPDQGGMYDVFATTFVDNASVKIFGYVVTQECEMRIDLICREIYNNIKHTGFLLSINNILNPLSISEGTIMLYVNEKDIDKFKQGKINSDKVRQDLVNANKGNKKDPARIEFQKNKKQNDALPPTIKKDSSPNVIVNTNTQEIILAPNIISKSLSQINKK